MASRATKTFGTLSSPLKALGLVLSQRDSADIFLYPGGGPVTLLPAYKRGQVVNPLHRVMVRKQLEDSGLLRTG